MADDSITIRRARPDEAGRINLFYAGRGYVTIVDDDLGVFIAEDGGNIIGVMRLCVEEGYTILRTVHVQDEYRGRNVGRRMLEAFQEAVRDVDCYCVPYAHLVHFYGIIGFRQIELEQAPPHLAERMKGYRERGLDAILMMRKAD